MPFFNFPAAQLRRRILPRIIWGHQNKIVLGILSLILLVTVFSVFNAAHLDYTAPGGWNTSPKMAVRAGGIPGPLCEVPLEDIPPGQVVQRCAAVIADGVCILRSCAQGDGEGGLHDAGPPLEVLAGTPTVDKDDAWRQAQFVGRGDGATCTGSCNEADDKQKVKKELGVFRVPGAVSTTQFFYTKPRPSDTRIRQKPNVTQTSDIPLQTNVESGEPKGVMRGVGWSSCASSAALLGLVAIGVVVLL